MELLLGQWCCVLNEGIHVVVVVVVVESEKDVAISVGSRVVVESEKDVA